VTEAFSTLVAMLLKLGAVALVFNEIRGLVLAAPVLYGMYTAGGTWMALWVGFSTLGGIALTVIVPLIAAQRLRKLVTVPA
jgi:hypothetical protein